MSSENERLRRMANQAIRERDNIKIKRVLDYANSALDTAENYAREGSQRVELYSYRGMRKWFSKQPRPCFEADMIHLVINLALQRGFIAELIHEDNEYDDSTWFKVVVSWA